MIAVDLPPVAYEPPAIVQEVRKGRRGRSSRSPRYRSPNSGQTYRVTGPRGMLIVLGMYLVLNDTGETCQVVVDYQDGTYGCRVQ